MTSPDPSSWKLPRLTTLPLPMRPGFSAFGVYVQREAAAVHEAPNGGSRRGRTGTR